MTFLTLSYPPKRLCLLMTQNASKVFMDHWILILCDKIFIGFCCGANSGLYVSIIRNLSGWNFSPKSHAPINHTYFINSEPVLQQDHHRDLGIIMSSDLSWSAHYSHLLSNSYKMLHLLRRIFSKAHCPFNKRALYVSLVKSKLMYNSLLWRPQLIKDIIVIELLQQRATKYILSDHSSSYKARLISFKLLPTRDCCTVTTYQSK